jgi:uncharacterized membrane protein
MAFCASCGTEVSGQFCPKCGATIAGGVPAGSPGLSAPAASAPMATNIASALCYIPIVAIIFLLIDPYKQDRTIRFHAFQSLGLLVTYIGVQIALMFVHIAIAMMSSGLSLLFSLVGMLVGLGFFILWVFLVIKAYQNQRIVLPVIGQFAEKQA